MGGRKPKILGYCDNPNNYFFGSEIDELLFDSEKEECGMRTCRGCPHFVSIYDSELPRIDATDIQEEWDRWEEDQIAQEINGGLEQ